MARCTAPVRGHTRGGGADCPVCGPRYGRRWGGSSSYDYGYSRSSLSSHSTSSRSGSGGGGGGSRKTTRPRWAPSSTVLYTPVEVQELEPVRQNVEKQTTLDRRDYFLCHAWDDRQSSLPYGLRCFEGARLNFRRFHIHRFLVEDMRRRGVCGMPQVYSASAACLGAHYPRR